MKPRQRKELAVWYNYSTKTFRRILKAKAIDVPDRNLLCIKDQIIIYDCLGIPSGLPEEEQEEVETRLKDYQRSKEKENTENEDENNANDKLEQDTEDEQ